MRLLIFRSRNLRPQTRLNTHSIEEWSMLERNSFVPTNKLLYSFLSSILFIKKQTRQLENQRLPGINAAKL